MQPNMSRAFREPDAWFPVLAWVIDSLILGLSILSHLPLPRNLTGDRIASIAAGLAHLCMCAKGEELRHLSGEGLIADSVRCEVAQRDLPGLARYRWGLSQTVMLTITTSMSVSVTTVRRPSD
jgi:hypothetical protein